MSEKNYETSELKELKDVLQTFTEFVWEMEEYLPEFYHFFDAMRQNIEIFLRVGEEDEEQIHEILGTGLGESTCTACGSTVL